MCLRHYQQMLYRTATPAQIEHRRRLGREQANERRRRDPAADRARVRAWQKQNPERYRAIQARRRARRRDATVVRFTREQILAKVAYWGGRCWICGGSYEVIDHVKPLARGGAHMLSNLRPACRTCNLSKGGKWPYQPPPTGTV
jgi:5-methylcytosine-specific restriction endonuclease McrA